MATNRYLHNSDYTVVIQDAQLAQVVQNDQNKLLKAERIAQEEVSYYLTQRWDLAYEFTNTGAWSPTKAYMPHDRVIIDYDDYNIGLTYSPNSTVIYNGAGYVCNATQSNGAFDIADWNYLGPQYTIYYIQYPTPLFNYLAEYNIGDVVYWTENANTGPSWTPAGSGIGYTWSCNISSQNMNTTQQNQYLKVSNIPPYNVFPDDRYTNANDKYWGRGNTYSVPVGTLPTDDTYWQEGDNRSAQILGWYMDIVLYHLHRTIAPRAVPELRVSAWKQAKESLTSVAEGTNTLDALVRQPKAGAMIRWGSDTSNPINW